MNKFASSKKANKSPPFPVYLKPQLLSEANYGLYYIEVGDRDQTGQSTQYATSLQMLLTCWPLHMGIR